MRVLGFTFLAVVGVSFCMADGDEPSRPCPAAPMPACQCGAGYAGAGCEIACPRGPDCANEGARRSVALVVFFGSILGCRVPTAAAAVVVVAAAVAAAAAAAAAVTVVIAAAAVVVIVGDVGVVGVAVVVVNLDDL
eukprot:COSAG05_NODE_1878_length_3911_cov_62.469576_4_plen_136_part_00